MHLKDIFKLHFIVLIFGFTAIIGKLVSIPAVETVTYRTGIATLVLGAFMIIRKSEIIATKRTILKLVGIGFIVAIHWILFFGATKVSNVSICLVGISTTSVWTSIIEPLLTDKKFSLVDAFFGVLVIFGLYIIYSTKFDVALGLFMAILSAFFASLFSVLNFNLVNRHKVHQQTITVFEMLGAFLGTFMVLPLYKFYFFPEEEINFSLAGYDALWLLILGVVCTVYAYTASVEIMKRISAFTVNLTINLEPVYGIIMAFLLFPETERMNERFYAGASVILLTVLMYPVVKKKFKNR